MAGSLTGNDEFKKSIKIEVSKDCLRVNQLDATFLDSELNSSLKSQFVRIFKYLPMDFVMKYEIEIDYFIQITIFYFSIYRNRGLNGDKLQNIRFDKKLSLKKKIIYFLLTIFIPYLFKKTMRFMNDSGYNDFDETNYKKRIYKLLTKLSLFIRCLSLFHLIFFLFDGKYRSLIDRFCGIKMKYINNNLNRFVSFDFMNQQIVWNDISNFLLFILPLINFHKISMFISQTVTNIKYLFIKPSSKQMSEKEKMDNNNNDNIIPNDKCPICGISPITIPCKANCSGQHIYCYYCLSASLLNQGGRMRCPICYDLISQHRTLLPLP